MNNDKEYGAKGYGETPEGPTTEIRPRIVGRYQYRSIPAKSVHGMRQAGELRAHGWALLQAGYYTLLFEREIRRPEETEAERVRREGRA